MSTNLLLGFKNVRVISIDSSLCNAENDIAMRLASYLSSTKGNTLLISKGNENSYLENINDAEEKKGQMEKLKCLCDR